MARRDGLRLVCFTASYSRLLIGASILVLAASLSPAQAKQAQHVNNDSQEINVNWLYGAYLPKDAPLEPLNSNQRLRLYVRQTFTTPGIYIKTAAFSVRDQIADSPTQWGGAKGYAQRLLSRQAQFVIQNSISAAGNAVLGWEPRYDRCRCSGFWFRTRHAFVRNFVTYQGSEARLRPNLMPYVAAFGAGAIATSWQPGNPSAIVKGYQNAVAQIGVGVGVNWIGEFAPEIFSVFRKSKPKK